MRREMRRGGRGRRASKLNKDMCVKQRHTEDMYIAGSQEQWLTDASRHENIMLGLHDHDTER